MVVALLIIIILLLAPWLLGVIGMTAVGALGVIAFVAPVVAAIALIVGLVAGVHSLKKMTPEERKKVMKKIAIIAAAVLLVVGIFVAVISSINHDHYFEMGSICLGSSASEADEWFSKLPRSFHEQVVDECLRYAEGGKEYSNFYSTTLPILNLAEKYAGQDMEKQDHIQALRREYALVAGEAETASDMIMEDYRLGRLTGQEAVQYAVKMYESVSEDELYFRSKKDMRDAALALVSELAETVPEAKEKHDEWSVLPREYQQAIDWVNAHENYQEAAAWFAAHADYQRSAEYLSLCTGINKLCGTWKAADGSIFTLSVDTTQPVEMLYVNQEIGSFPWKINLLATLNGKDISFYHDTLWAKGMDYQCHIEEEDMSYKGEVRYNFSYGGVFSPYTIRMQGDGTIQVTYTTAERTSKSSIAQTKQWTKTFSKVE